MVAPVRLIRPVCSTAESTSGSSGSDRQGLISADSFESHCTTVNHIGVGSTWKWRTELGSGHSETDTGHALKIVEAAVNAALGAQQNLSEAGLVGLVAATGFHLALHSHYSPIENQQNAESEARKFIGEHLEGDASNRLSSMNKEDFRRLFTAFAGTRISSERTAKKSVPATNPLATDVPIHIPVGRRRQIFETIQNQVAAHYGRGHEHDWMTSSLRPNGDLLEAQRIAMFLCREITTGLYSCTDGEATFEEIARFFHKKSHKTAHGAYTEILRACTRDTEFEKKIELLRTTIVMFLATPSASSDRNTQGMINGSWKKNQYITLNNIGDRIAFSCATLEHTATDAPERDYALQLLRRMIEKALEGWRKKLDPKGLSGLLMATGCHLGLHEGFRSVENLEEFRAEVSKFVGLKLAEHLNEPDCKINDKFFINLFVDFTISREINPTDENSFRTPLLRALGHIFRTGP